MIDVGEVSAAIRLVKDEGKITEPDIISLASMREKHPPAPGPAEVPDVAEAPIALDRTMLELAVRAMSAASAPGPDGLRPSNLKQFLNAAGAAREHFLDSLTEFAAVVTANKFPTIVASYF